jgi:hypothetical protein
MIQIIYFWLQLAPQDFKYSFECEFIKSQQVEKCLFLAYKEGLHHMIFVTIHV